MSKIVMTGGSSGFGAEIMAALLRYNHEVWDFSALEHDVRDFEDCKAFMKASAKDGNIDILINCAGVSRLEWLENTTEDDWDYMFDTNCKGIFNIVRAALPFLHGGTIFNVCSKSAFVPMTCTHIYNASKAAVHMMTLQMARELKPRHDITVFGLGPNDMEGTGMSGYVDSVVPKLRGWTPEQAETYAQKNRPAGAPTPPRIIADLVAYLLQDKEHHKFLTGAIIPYGI